jgi:sodium transport system permease protein
LKNGLGLTVSGSILIILLLVPLVAFFASLLVAVSTFAKNAREAQTYLSLASFVVIIPAMFSQFIGLTEFSSASWINFVPVLNTSNNIRMTLMGKPDYAGSGIAIGICLVLAAIMVRYTVVLFQRETVLVRV